MYEADKQRIENAVWTLFQYQQEIEELSSQIKLDKHELEAMFRVLSYVRALMVND